MHSKNLSLVNKTTPHLQYCITMYIPAHGAGDAIRTSSAAKGSGLVHDTNKITGPGDKYFFPGLYNSNIFLNIA